MSNSLSEQLLKAGLITQAQIDQAEQTKQQQKEKAKEAREQAKLKPAKPNRNFTPKPHKPAAAKPEGVTTPQADKQPAPNKPAKPRKSSDLEQFYRERNELERQEKAAEEQRRREMAERKKQTRQQVRELISAHLKNVDDAAIRYNFVVGETVKYLYVTEQQQQDLAAGTLAITFLEGKRCLIPSEIAEQILVIDPDKLIVLNKEGMETEELVVPELVTEAVEPSAE